MRKIAVSDIHGCVRTFRELIKTIDLSKEDDLFLLGDYVDRGPDSAGVIDFITALRDDGYKVHTLLGNHEEMLLNSFHDSFQHKMWLFNGGRITMKSFGASELTDIPEKYLDFIHRCDRYLEAGEYIFVHAGLDFRHDDPFSEESALIWIRNWQDNIDYDWLGDRYIVHGHTPVTKLHIRFLLEGFDSGRHLNIDNGCFHIQDPEDKGALCAVDLTNKQLYFQKNIDQMEDWWLS